MATQQKQQNKNAETGSSSKSEQAIERKPASAELGRRDYEASPFSLVRRLSNDIDRLFSDLFAPSLLRWSDWPTRMPRAFGEVSSWPDIEVRQKGDKLIVEADVPGLTKDDVSVEVRDNELCISGERRSESERSEAGYYRSERSYGSFYRTIPLPRGAKPDTASATFENGVLRVEIETPGAQARGRRVEVREGSPH